MFFPKCRQGRRIAVTTVTLCLVLCLCGALSACRRPSSAIIEAGPLASALAQEAGGVAAAQGGGAGAVEAPPEMCVHVSGAAINPGVYRLAAGSRACDALAAAGGARRDACLDLINLAAPVSDGQQVHIPTEDEAALVASAGGGHAAATPGPGVTGGIVGSRPLNINRATLNQLVTLPGIGPVLAARIIDYRAAHGPFAKVDDLVAVSGIGPSRLADLRPHVTTGP